MEISITQYFYEVFGGISFWFISAIVVSQIILQCLLFIRRKTVWPYFAVSLFLFGLSIFLSDIDKTPFPWYYKSGLGATLFLTLGGIYQQYEKEIEGKFNNKMYATLILLYIACVIYNLNHNVFHNVITTMSFNLGGIVVSILH